MMCAHRSARGFSLIEVLIVLVLMGILASLSYPAITSTMGRTRLARAKQAVTGALQFARFQAVLRKRAQIFEMELPMNGPGGSLVVRESTSGQCNDVLPETRLAVDLPEDIGLVVVAPVVALMGGICFKPNGKAYEASAALPPRMSVEEQRAFNVTRSSNFAFRLQRFEKDTQLEVDVRSEVLLSHLGVTRVNRDLSETPEL